jgi:cytidylate kinase
MLTLFPDPFHIAIDGPSGAGKSTTARRLAEELGLTYLDTGAMYRSLALYQLKHPSDTEMPLIGFDPSLGPTVNGVTVGDRIRTAEIAEHASTISALPSVRHALVEQQRRMMETGRWVAEGRDIGSNVLPNAALKVYLDADPRERAERRVRQNNVQWDSVMLEAEYQAQLIRDH